MIRSLTEVNVLPLLPPRLLRALHLLVERQTPPIAYVERLETSERRVIRP